MHRHRRPRIILIAASVLLALGLAACDNNSPPPAPTSATVSTNQPSPVDTAPVTPFPTVGDDLPTPSPVTATSTGEAVTTLQALPPLKERALAWQQDSRIAILANVRPGQQESLLTGALGDADTYEPTPAGKGRNWTLVVFSASGDGAYAFSMDGTQVDLVKQGVTTDVVHQSFAAPASANLDLAKLDTARLVDSDSILQRAGDIGKSDVASLAMLAADALGMGPMPTPGTGGAAPHLIYEMFLIEPARQAFIFFDALTGEIILDLSKP